jgi:hypothetical protein
MNCVTELYIHVILALIILYLLCNWIIKMNFFLVMPKVFSSANYLRPSSPLLRVWDNSFFDINQQSYQWDTTSNHHCYENFRRRELASLVIINSNTIVGSWENFERSSYWAKSNNICHYIFIAKCPSSNYKTIL